MRLFGQLLKYSPEFRGKARLVNIWLEWQRRLGEKAGTFERTLPGGFRLPCQLCVPYEAMIWLHREEEADLAVLRQLLRAGQTFVDCGANIGLWSLTAASCVMPEGKVFAFEPNPHTFRRLVQNLELNKVAGIVEANNCACGREAGAGFLTCPTEHNTCRMSSRAADNSVQVKIVTLDDVLQKKRVHGIKIDVEGAEMEVLEGAKSVIRDSRPWICVEFNTLLAGVRRLGDWPVHHLLSSFNYSCCRFVDAVGSPRQFLKKEWETDAYINLFYWPSG